jgi:hypothetical protein
VVITDVVITDVVVTDVVVTDVGITDVVVTNVVTSQVERLQEELGLKEETMRYVEEEVCACACVCGVCARRAASHLHRTWWCRRWGGAAGLVRCTGHTAGSSRTRTSLMRRGVMADAGIADAGPLGARRWRSCGPGSSRRRRS